MEIAYNRSLMTSSMILEAGEAPAEWEERMIANLKTDRVLFGEWEKENGRARVWYDITGKQSLQQFLEDAKLGYDLLADLLFGIYETVEQTESMLLCTDAILLLPETIFLDYRSGKVIFCYYPGYGKTLPEAFAVLMEYLLVHLDHGDEKAVKLAYDAYGRIPKGSIKMLADLLCTPYESECGTDDGPADTVSAQRRGEPEQEAMQRQEEPPKHSKKRDGVLLIWKKKVRLPQVFDSVCKVCRGIWEKAGRRSGRTDGEAYVFAPEEGEPSAVMRPTVLLQEISRPPEGILRYEGNGACTDLKIEGESCVIGSDRTCECYVPSATVSRRHARITRRGELFFIEDLNSANGTYVGGTLLNYRTRMSLEKNEIILLADEKFRFI